MPVARHFSGQLFVHGHQEIYVAVLRPRREGRSLSLNSCQRLFGAGAGDNAELSRRSEAGIRGAGGRASTDLSADQFKGFEHGGTGVLNSPRSGR